MPVRSRRVRTRPTALFAVLALSLPLVTGFTRPPGEPVKVMSRNLYLGADLTPVLAAPLAQLPLAAAEVFGKVLDSDFPARARAVAEEIRAAKPDLIGLQEVGLWRTDTPPDGPATPAGVVRLDFLDALLAALDDLGLDYTEVARSTNFDGEVPTALGFDVRYTDADVVLARAGLSTTNAMHGNFTTALPFPNPMGGAPILSLRGWASVDATVHDRTFRFVNTHPEAYGPDIVRIGQTAELLAGPLATSLPVILVGDLNTEPGTAPYTMLTTAGFADSWTRPTAGYTCCQDELLRNETSTLDERIDYVLSKGLRAAAAQVIGESRGDFARTGGLWPSDHAGVVVSLQLR